MVQVIIIVVIIGMAYLGGVQIFLFMRRCYLQIMAFIGELKAFLRSRNKPNEGGLVPVSQTQQPDVVNKTPITPQWQDPAVSSPTEVSSHEIKIMSETLGKDTASEADERATVRTLNKLENTYLSDYIRRIAHNRLDELFEKYVDERTPLPKSDFDYSKYIIVNNQH